MREGGALFFHGGKERAAGTDGNVAGEEVSLPSESAV
jgi:hypothetical protein